MTEIITGQQEETGSKADVSKMLETEFNIYLEAKTHLLGQLSDRIRRYNSTLQYGMLPIVRNEYNKITGELDDALTALTTNLSLTTSPSRIKAINDLLNGGICKAINRNLREMAKVDNLQKSIEVTSIPIESFPPQSAENLTTFVQNSLPEVQNILQDLTPLTPEALRSNSNTAASVKQHETRLTELKAQLETALEHVQVDIEIYRRINSDKVQIIRTYMKYAQELTSIVQSQLVNLFRNRLMQAKSQATKLIYLADNPDVDPMANSEVGKALDSANQDLSSKSNNQLMKMHAELSAARVKLKQKLQDLEDSGAVDFDKQAELKKRIQELETAESKISGLHDSRLDEENKLYQKAAISTIVKFFDGGFARDFIPNYEDREWTKQSPERLATAVWAYIEEFIMVPQTSGDEPFIKMQIFDWTLPFDDRFTVGNLLDSFGNIGGILTPTDTERVEKFRYLSGKLAVDVAKTEKLYALGYGVKHNEGDLEALVGFLTAHTLDSDNMKKIANIGAGYQDKEQMVPLGGRMFYAMSGWLFLNDPKVLPEAILSDSTPEEPKFLYGVPVKNRLTYYPTGIEQTTDQNPAQDQLIKRMVCRLIASAIKPGEAPPWTKHPEWRRKIIRGKPETLSELASRRQDIGVNYMERLLFGPPGGAPYTARDSSGAMVRDPRCLYNRLYNYLNHNPVASEYLPNEAELKAIQKGYFAEQLSHNLMHYSLLPAKAEGVKLTKDSTVSIRIPVVDASSGPVGKNFSARTIVSAGAYTRKLTSGGQGGQGTHIPLNIKDKIQVLMQTLFDRHYLPAGDNARVGTTLRELLYVCEDERQFRKIPFNQIFIMGDTAPAWSDQLTLGKKISDMLFSGMGVDWNTVVQPIAGSEGAENTFNPKIAEKIKALSREVYYLLTRDFGRVVCSWSNNAEYQRFRAIELNYLAQLENTNTPIKPASINGVPVTQAEWNKVIEYSKLPTSAHRIVDGRNFDKKLGEGIVRIATNIDYVIAIPGLREHMNPFEQAVLLDPGVDALTKLQALIVGTLFIGDVYKNGKSRSMKADDVNALMEMFSKDFWDERQGIVGSAWKKNFKDFVRHWWYGIKHLPPYDGLGYFTPFMAKTLLEEAGVPTGLSIYVKKIVQDLKSISPH